MMACIIAIIGIGFVALPTGIISSGYVEELKKNSRNSQNDTITDLERIAALRENGHLTDEEFEKLKEKILNKCN